MNEENFQPVAQQKNLIKSSFFDNNEELSIIMGNDQTSIWLSKTSFEKYVTFNNITLSNDVLAQSYLFKKQADSNIIEENYFVLYIDRLECYKNNQDSEPEGIMHLLCTKVDFLENIVEVNNEDELNYTQNFCCFFTSNKFFEILFTNKQTIFSIWKQALKKCCILTYFSKSYNSLKVIGKGTFAKVLLCQRKIDNKQFAVKIFDKNSILHSAQRTKTGLINEIQVMRLLNHPNIIKLEEVYEGEGHIYLVLELLQGGELFDRIISKGNYSEQDSFLVMKQLLSSLQYLHSRNIMHRDIKPENLILKDDTSMEIKLADFGLADFANKSVKNFKRCGTPGYVAPEILEDLPYNKQVDAFSAGVIFYILLTGCSAFNGKSYNEILLKNKKCLINWQFEKINVRLSNNALDLLKRLLEKNPDQRITIGEALNHEWFKYFEKQLLEQSNIDFENDIEENIVDTNAAWKNMQKFQEDRFNVIKIKPQDGQQIMLTPVINGRVNQVNAQLTPSQLQTPVYEDKKGDPRAKVIKSMAGYGGKVGKVTGPKVLNSKMDEETKNDEAIVNSQQNQIKIKKAQNQLKKFEI